MASCAGVFPVPSDLGSICRDFLKTPTACNRGKDCKFVHLEWIKSSSPDGAPFCIMDIFGKCDRGIRCNFFHIHLGKTPSVSPSSLAPDGRQYCIDFKRGMCKKGHGCRFYHSTRQRVKVSPPPGLSWPTSRIPSVNPWTQKPDFRVANIRSFLGTREMDSTDEVFVGKNLYKVPIQAPPKPVTSTSIDDDAEEMLREPFTLFKKDPFILWKMVDGSDAACRTLRVSPAALSEA